MVYPHFCQTMTHALTLTVNKTKTFTGK